MTQTQKRCWNCRRRTSFNAPPPPIKLDRERRPSSISPTQPLTGSNFTSQNRRLLVTRLNRTATIV